MKLKKLVAITMTALTLMAIPASTAFAAHSHTWGAAWISNTEEVNPAPGSGKCITRYVYNTHQCLTCGDYEEWLASKMQMQHKMSNDICVFCGMGYARIIAK